MCKRLISSIIFETKSKSSPSRLVVACSPLDLVGMAVVVVVVVAVVDILLVIVLSPVVIAADVAASVVCKSFK